MVVFPFGNGKYMAWRMVDLGHSFFLFYIQARVILSFLSLISSGSIGLSLVFDTPAA